MNAKQVADYIDTLISEDVIANDEAPIEHTSTVLEPGVFWLYLSGNCRFRVEVFKES